MISQQVPVDLVLGPLGLLAFLLFFVVLGGMRQWWVFGFHYRNEREEKLYWRQTAMRTLITAEKGMEVAKTFATDNMTLEEMAKLVEAARQRGELP